MTHITSTNEVDIADVDYNPVELLHAESLVAKIAKIKNANTRAEMSALLSLAVRIVTADYEYRDDAINMLEEFLR